MLYTPRTNTCHLGLLLMLAGDIPCNPGPNHFKLSVINAQSLRNKHNSLSVHTAAETPEVLCVTETWLSTKDTAAFIAEVTPTGYTLVHNPRESRGGGVAIFAKNSLTLQKLSTSPSTSFESVAASICSDNKKLNFACIYRPPHSSITLFMSEFEGLLKSLAESPHDTIYCGDFNIPYNLNSQNKIKFQNLLETLDLTQHVNIPTHKFGNILDLVITPSEPVLVKSVRSSGNISDHFCLTANLDLRTSYDTTRTPITFRRYHKINSHSLRSDLLNSTLITNPPTTASAV